MVATPMREALERWITLGELPGDFLQAVLRNDLVDAACRADEDNAPLLTAYGRFLQHYAPSGCYGSPALVDNWVASRTNRAALKWSWPGETADAEADAGPDGAGKSAAGSGDDAKGRGDANPAGK